MLLFCTILLLASLACRFSATPEVEPVETVVEPVETPPPACSTLRVDTVTTLVESPQRQWLLTDSQTAKAEPEPFVGTSHVWVFYNVIEGDNPLTAVWHLYRAETPIR